jgi:gliding motility-associated-like protein
MKILNLLLFIISINLVYSQNCPYIGPDLTLPCGVNSTTLTADLSQCGPGGANPNQTTNYGVTNIAYSNQTNTGTQLFMTDDSQQGPFNIGFNFCFFGTTYTQFYVGSNGWISFSGGQPTTFTTQTIPTGNALVPKNCIMGPWQDWHPGLGGQIRYQMSGVAPCRKLTVSWIGVPMFSCTGNQGTFHIVIYESTNVIENYIQNKPACLQWQNGTATQGIHNLAGTIGIAVPGRNSSAWVANNDAWRWTPSGPTVLPVWTWYQVGNPVAIGTGLTITVTPPPGGAQYTCRPVYPICNAGWSSCNANGSVPDTILVTPTPNLPTPNVQVINPLCHDSCTGQITVTPIGGLAPYTINWNGAGIGLSINNLCPGTYNFTLTDAGGCTYNGSPNVINPPSLQSPTITPTNPVCFSYCDGQAIVNPVDGVAPYTFIWSNTQTTQTATGLCAGNYSVLVLDANNCPATQTTTLVDPLQVTLNPITGLDTLCFNSNNNTYLVTSPFANLTYNWTTTIGNITSGQTTPQINLDVNGVNAGNYTNAISVIGTDVNGCFSPAQNFTITILNIIPQITQIGPFCIYDDCQLLTALPTGGQFTGPGVNGNQFCPQQSNIPISQIIYTYNQSNCTFIQTSDITVYPRPNITQIDPDDAYIQLCDGEDSTNLTLNVISNILQTTNYWYLNGDSIQSQTLNSNFGEGVTIISAIVEANGCYSDPYNTSVNVNVCPQLVYYIPNSFTPDDDEYNPNFGVVFTDGFSPYEFHLEIWNRWGEIIWESFDHNAKWDGTYNNFPCQSGIYTWKIRFGNEDNDGFNIITGHLNLIR